MRDSMVFYRDWALAIHAKPEEEQLASRTKLPPRVNMQDAYKPAATPRKPGRRSRNS